MKTPINSMFFFHSSPKTYIDKLLTNYAGLVGGKRPLKISVEIKEEGQANRQKAV